MPSSSAHRARSIDRYFESYAADHRNVVNQRIHVVAVPAILWSVVALLWCLPPLITWLQHGIWAAFAMFIAWSWYNKHSRPLAIGLLLLFFVCGCVCRLLEARFGIAGLLRIGVAVFVLAWIAQFIGHHLEGRRPSFLTDLTYLLVGPGWVMAKLYDQMGWRY